METARAMQGRLMSRRETTIRHEMPLSGLWLRVLCLPPGLYCRLHQ